MKTKSGIVNVERVDRTFRDVTDKLNLDELTALVDEIVTQTGAISIATIHMAYMLASI